MCTTTTSTMLCSCFCSGSGSGLTKPRTPLFSFSFPQIHSLIINNKNNRFYPFNINNNNLFRAAIEKKKDDSVTLFFQAEGTMNEAAIPTVTNALKAAEGISNLKVQIVEGIASVELTTTQDTGVASGLVKIIQGSGFKLQTLNLEFVDEDENEEHIKEE